MVDHIPWTGVRTVMNVNVKNIVMRGKVDRVQIVVRESQEEYYNVTDSQPPLSLFGCPILILFIFYIFLVEALFDLARRFFGES